MAPHSSTLACKIPWTEEPGRLQSMGSLRVRHNWAASLSLFTSCIGEGNGNPLQYSCLENPRDGGAWWAAVYGVPQSRTQLKRLSSSSSKGGTEYNLRVCVCVCVCVAGRFSHVWVFAVLWTVTHQVPLSMGFSRQEYWSGLPFPPPGDLPNPGIEPWSHVSCIGSWVLYHERHLGSPEYNLPLGNYWIQKFPSKQTSWGMAEN